MSPLGQSPAPPQWRVAKFVPQLTVVPETQCAAPPSAGMQQVFDRSSQGRPHVGTKWPSVTTPIPPPPSLMPEEEPDDEPDEDEEPDVVPDEAPLEEGVVPSPSPPPFEPPLELDGDEPLLVLVLLLESSSRKPPPAVFPHDVIVEAVAAVIRTSETDQSQKKGDRAFKKPPVRIVPGGDRKRSRLGASKPQSPTLRTAREVPSTAYDDPKWPPMRFAVPAERSPALGEGARHCSGTR